MWAEPEPGPSGREPIRTGYCGTCRELYCNLEEHLSSLRHLDSVRSSRLSVSVSSRGKPSTPSVSPRGRLTLMERFLHDVHKHHPHRYHDASPSHCDLPSVSMAALSSCPSADPERLLPREQGPGPPHTHTEPPQRPPANDANDANSDPLSPGGLGPCGPIRAKHTEATPPYDQATPPLHRKAHRKTNRRKHSDSSPEHSPQTHTDTQSPGPITEQHTPSTHSEDWDTPVQVTETEGRDYSGLVNVTVNLTDEGFYSQQLHSALYQEVTSQPPAANQGPGFLSMMSHRDTITFPPAANQEPGFLSQPIETEGEEPGYLSRPIESVLPAPRCFPESFRGKSWRQIEREDEDRVEKMVRQFRGGRFRCYFDSDSLDRFGGRSQTDKGEEPYVLPLLAGDSDDSLPVRRRKRRSYRVTSRCQVVRVSHSTQTNNPVSLARPSVWHREATPPTGPAANQSAAETTPPTGPAANQSAAETPAPWRQIPPSYSRIMTPLQRRTSLVYLLCSPDSSPFTTLGPSPLGHAHRQSRRKRRPLEPQGSKVKYKPLPVCVYEPSSNRIMQTGHAPLGPSPLGHASSCVRQLFKSLSHNTNTAGQSARSRPVRSQTKAMRGRSQTTRTQPSTPRRTNTHTQRHTQRNKHTHTQKHTLTPRREGLRPRAPNRQ